MLTPVARTGLLLALLTILGCARTTRDPTVPRVERDVLTQEQVLETRTTNAFEAIATLRSNWLIPRGVDSFSNPGQVLVYFNDTRLGGVVTLQGISLNEIGYIQYFDGTEASARWGLDHGHGVIYVSTLPPR
jgi:hypothetical protein